MKGLIFTLLLATAQTALAAKESYCPPGSSTDRNGLYAITDPGEGFLSPKKDKWPWSRTHFERIAKRNPTLELVCIEPDVPARGVKQRRAVYRLADDSRTYVFGALGPLGEPAGVASLADMEQLNAFVGKQLWFTGAVEDQYFSTLENLVPYQVVGTRQRNSVVDNHDHYLIVERNGKRHELPMMLQKGEFSPAKGFYSLEEPTAESLDVTATELELIREGRVAVGMSEMALYRSVGFPRSTHRTETANSLFKQLDYRWRYIYVDNGRVSAIQDAR